MSIRFQGILFCLIAWLVLLAIPLLPDLSTEIQLLILSPIILFMGVPHGALDTVYARQYVGVKSITGWGLFSLAYVLAAALVVGLWWVTPGIFLAAFLLISAFHFSGDPDGEKTSMLFRILYGGSVIICPLVLHQLEVLSIFAYLAGYTNAQIIVATLNWIAWPWTIALGIVAIAGVKKEPLCSLELVSVAALLIFLPPLLGFTIFFCGMHSARHVLRTRDYSLAESLGSLMRIALWPMAITFTGVAVAWWLSEGIDLDMRLAQLLFVGLAALTVPHMLVIEKVRLTGWTVGRSITSR
jgi:Brp/Blh family beta-carotene 15,15'-monooxygenase